MAIQAKYINKVRDKNNNIIGYTIMDGKGRTINIQSNELKQSIKLGKLELINLTLTKDNRLVDKGKQGNKSEKQVEKRKITDIYKDFELMLFNNKQTRIEKELYATTERSYGTAMSDYVYETMWDYINNTLGLKNKIKDEDDYIDTSKFNEAHLVHFFYCALEIDEQYVKIRDNVEQLIKGMDDKKKLDAELIEMLAVQSVLMTLNIKGEFAKEIKEIQEVKEEFDNLINQAIRQNIYYTIENYNGAYEIKDFIKLRGRYLETTTKVVLRLVAKINRYSKEEYETNYDFNAEQDN